VSFLFFLHILSSLSYFGPTHLTAPSHSCGDTRLLTPIWPAKTPDLEKSILRNQILAGLKTEQRIISEQKLFSKINAFWPFKELTLKELQNILTYWNHVGKYFL
jgi:hypothetical protein